MNPSTWATAQHLDSSSTSYGFVLFSFSPLRWEQNREVAWNRSNETHSHLEHKHLKFPPWCDLERTTHRAEKKRRFPDRLWEEQPSGGLSPPAERAAGPTPELGLGACPPPALPSARPPWRLEAPAPPQRRRLRGAGRALVETYIPVWALTGSGETRAGPAADSRSREEETKPPPPSGGRSPAPQPQRPLRPLENGGRGETAPSGRADGRGAAARRRRAPRRLFRRTLPPRGVGDLPGDWALRPFNGPPRRWRWGEVRWGVGNLCGAAGPGALLLFWGRLGGREVGKIGRRGAALSAPAPAGCVRAGSGVPPGWFW